MRNAAYTKYMKRLMLVLPLSLFAFSLLTSCIKEEEFDNTPEGNFEALWKVIDERYCFLDYKQHEIGLDWQQIHSKYRVRINNEMRKQQLFEVLADMLGELRDGHVNISASHDLARNWSWYENYPTNLSDTLLRRYMGTKYKIASGLKYCILDDNIGYIRYESFNKGIGEGNLNEVFMHMMLCQGLIIDIRSNGGGDLSYAELFAARFCTEKTLVGYLQHKTGKGHSDFSEMQPCYIEPTVGIRWNKPVCVLTNRGVYSAANEFTMYMKALPNVKIVGDYTGGGAGMPFTNTLPNGWIVRFSAVPTYDKDKNSVEFGIAPHYNVQLTSDDFLQGKDTIIEFARKLLKE